MGSIVDAATGKLTFNNTPSTTEDMNALSDRIEAVQKNAVPTVNDLPTSGNTPDRLLYVDAVNGWYRWDGSEWKPLSLSGSVAHASMTIGNGGGLYWTTNYTVTFATPFDTPPSVYPGESNTDAIQWPILHAVTATSFQFRVVRVGSTPQAGTFHWRADAN